MPKITICERPSASSSASEGFAAAVRMSGAEYPIVVRDPFDEQQEQLLEWYFERWLERPYVKAYGLRAETARQSIRDYGEALFDQVFADRRAYKGYADLREHLEQVQIEIEGSPAFQALHWEALREPLDEPTDSSRPNLPLSVDCMMLRKLGKAGSVRVDESPVVNLLVVVARPGEENDVGYRTIARPLIETIGKSQLRVNVDILRPGTYEAFVKQLDPKRGGLLSHRAF